MNKLICGFILLTSLSALGKQPIEFLNTTLLKYGTLKVPAIEVVKDNVPHYFAVLTPKIVELPAKEGNIFASDLFDTAENGVSTKVEFIVLFKKNLENYEVTKIFSVDMCPFRNDDCSSFSNKVGGASLEIQKVDDFLVVSVVSSGVIGAHLFYDDVKKYYLKFMNDHFEIHQIESSSITRNIDDEAVVSSSKKQEDLSKQPEFPFFNAKDVTKEYLSKTSKPDFTKIFIVFERFSIVRGLTNWLLKFAQ